MIHEPAFPSEKEAGSKLQVHDNFSLHSVFQASWGYIASSCLKKQTKNTK